MAVTEMPPIDREFEFGKTAHNNVPCCSPPGGALSSFAGMSDSDSSSADESKRAPAAAEAAKPKKKATRKKKAKKVVEEEPPPEVFVFGSEAVCDGHPDKICDAIADAILDSILSQDRNSKVAVEVIVAKDMLMVFGEVASAAACNYEGLARDVVKDLGYDDVAKGLDYRSMLVVVNVEAQSPDIAQGVFMDKRLEDIGAGDQAVVFGYATDERDGEQRDRDASAKLAHHYMPTSHRLALVLAKRLGEARRLGEIPWLRPDGKVLVVMEHERRWERIHGNHRVCVPVATRCVSITISVQHAEKHDGVALSHDVIKRALMEQVVDAVVPRRYRDRSTIYYFNPAGRFVTGGPLADSGMTGRKSEVDCYGGWCANGGGSFSGKDATKVDRSGAYLARNIAKTLVHHELCRRCTVSLAYAIGVPYPLHVSVDSHGTVISHGREHKTDRDLEQIAREAWDLRVGPANKELELGNAVFQKTALFGHFGWNDPDHAWETCKELGDT